MHTHTRIEFLLEQVTEIGYLLVLLVTRQNEYLEARNVCDIFAIVLFCNNFNSFEPSLSKLHKVCSFVCNLMEGLQMLHNLLLDVISTYFKKFLIMSVNVFLLFSLFFFFFLFLLICLFFLFLET